jgi:hypothetical protein
LIRQSAPPRKFEQTLSVQIDKKTGTITGWDSLFKLLEAEDAAKINKTAMDDIGKGAKKLMQKLRPGDYVVL